MPPSCPNFPHSVSDFLFFFAGVIPSHSRFLEISTERVGFCSLDSTMRKYCTKVLLLVTFCSYQIFHSLEFGILWEKRVFNHKKLFVKLNILTCNPNMKCLPLFLTDLKSLFLLQQIIIKSFSRDLSTHRENELPPPSNKTRSD